MLVFGIDIPLVEIILVFSLIAFVLLSQAIFIILLQTKQLGKMKKMSDLLHQLSENLIQFKNKQVKK